MVGLTHTPSGLIQVAGAAPIVSSSAVGQVGSGLAVEWDFDGDGDFVTPPNVTAVPDATGLVRWWAASDFVSESDQTLTGRATAGVATLGTGGTVDTSDPAIVLQRGATVAQLVPDGINDHLQTDYTPTFTATTGAFTAVFIGVYDDHDASTSFVRWLSSESANNDGFRIGGASVVSTQLNHAVGGATTVVQQAFAVEPADGEVFATGLVVDNGTMDPYLYGHGLNGTVDITGVGVITHAAIRAFKAGFGGSGASASPMRHVLIFERALTEAELDAIVDLLTPTDTGIENITAAVLSMSTLTGRDYPSQLHGRAAPGRMRLVVDNSDDRFQPFSTDSPLTTNGNSLDAGRRIRVRDASTTAHRPALLARDTFQGTGALGDDELGNTWTLQGAGVAGSTSTSPARDEGRLVLPKSVNASSLWTVDVGVSDYAVQLTSSAIRPAFVGVVYRFADISNYGVVYYDGAVGVTRLRKIAGSFTSDETIAIEPNIQPVTVTVVVSGSTVDVYLNGQEIMTGTAAGTTEQSVGFRGVWQGQTASPVIDEFHAWDMLATDLTGPIWGGFVDRVDPSINQRGEKIATIDCSGPLAKLANTDVDPPDTVGVSVVSEGITTGQAVSDVLQKTDTLHPPVADGISASSSVMGAATIERQRGLSAARKVEAVEAGFLHETRDGDIIFDARDDRSAAVVQSGWSDSDGLQFHFESVQLLDSRRETINEVRAEVSPRIPSAVGSAWNAFGTAAGVQRTIDTPPSVAGSANPGDLHLTVIMTTVRTADEFWLIPPGFVALADRGDELGRVRIYAKILEDGDDGSPVDLYADASSAGGAFARYTLSVTNWFGSIEDGVAVSTRAVGLPNQQTEARGGSHSFAPLIPPWGRSSGTFFVAGLAGAVSSNGGLQVSTPVDGDLPDGFDNPTGTSLAGTVDAFDVAGQVGLFEDITNLLQPTPFLNGFNGFDYLDTFTIAVRGYAGSAPSGNRGQVVVAKDQDSINRVGTINTHPAPGKMFEDVAAATSYGEHVLSKFAVVRPLLKASFTATKNAGYRTQAVERRVGDKIFVDLTGRSGINARGPYFIESIAHETRDGDRLWRTTWTLSPA